MATKPIKIEIIGDAKGFKGALGDADRGISGLTGTLGKLGAAVAGAFAATKIIDFGTEIFGLASDLTDINQKIDTVFGDQGADVRAWADTLNESFGTTTTQVSLMAANIADLLKPMGATTEEAAGISKEMVELAPALAEWSGGTKDAAEVSEILAKAMLGEREQLKSLGISINQAEVNTRALEIAQREGRDEVSAMDKALATQQLILEKSTDAQDGYVTGTHTLAGQQALLKAKFAELKETLAARLTPALLVVGNFLIDHLAPVFEELRGGIHAFAAAWTSFDGDVTSSGFPGFMEKAAFKLRTFVERVKEFWEKHGPQFRSILSSVLRVVGRLAAWAFPVLTSAIETVAAIIGEVFKFLDENKEVLIGIAVVITAKLAIAFGAWAITAGLAAIATLAASAPLIALGVVVAAFVALVIKAYRENERFRSVIQAIGRFFRDTLLPIIKAVAAWIWDVFIPAVVDLARRFRDWLWPIIKSIVAWIRDELIPGAKDVVAKLKDWITTAVNVARRVRSKIQEIVNKVISFARTVFNKGQEIYDSIVNPFRDAIDWVKRKWQGLKDTVTKAFDIPNPFSGIGGGIPFFASGTSSFAGGMATVGERGPERVYLPRGSRVEPAHLNRGGSGSGGDTFVINGANTSATELAREIAWLKRVGDGR